MTTNEGRAVRMFEEPQSDAHEESQRASLRSNSLLSSIPADKIRGWVNGDRVDAGEKAGLTISEREETKALRKGLAKVKRANEILKSASAMLAAAE